MMRDPLELPYTNEVCTANAVVTARRIQACTHTHTHTHKLFSNSVYLTQGSKQEVASATLPGSEQEVVSATLRSVRTHTCEFVFGLTRRAFIKESIGNALAPISAEARSHSADLWRRFLQ